MHLATANQMVKLDGLAVKHGLEIRQMMELAGWYMLAVFKKFVIPTGSKAVVAVGNGNKGGDGLAAARILDPVASSQNGLQIAPRFAKL